MHLKALFNRQWVILFSGSKGRTELDLVTQEILSYERSEKEISHLKGGDKNPG